MNAPKSAPDRLAEFFGGELLDVALRLFGSDGHPRMQLTPVIADAPGRQGLRLVHAAVQLGDSSVLALLISAGCDMSVADDAGMSPIHYAAMRSDPELTRMLLDAGVDPDLKNAMTGETPLFGAVRRNLRDETLMLLAQGADVNATDAAAYTILHHGALSGHAERILDLLQFGADPEARSPQGKTFQDYLWTTPDNFYQGEAKAARLAVRRWLELNGIPVVGGAGR